MDDVPNDPGVGPCAGAGGIGNLGKSQGGAGAGTSVLAARCTQYTCSKFVPQLQTHIVHTGTGTGAVLPANGRGWLVGVQVATSGVTGDIVLPLDASGCTGAEHAHNVRKVIKVGQHTVLEYSPDGAGIPCNAQVMHSVVEGYGVPDAKNQGA